MSETDIDIEAISRRVDKQRTKLDNEAELLALAQQRADRAGRDVESTAGAYEAAKKARDDADAKATRLRHEAKSARQAAKAAAAEQQAAVLGLASQEKAHAKRGKKLAKAEAALASVTAGREVEKSVAKTTPAKKTPAKQATAKRATAKKAPARKAPVKKATARKAPAKKTTARKAPAKKTTARKTTREEDDGAEGDREEDDGEEDNHQAQLRRIAGATGAFPAEVSTRSLRSRLNHRGASLCHDPGVPVKENGPGIGFWIAVGIGAVAGAFALYLGAGVWLSLGVFVVVAVAMGLLLS